MGLSSISIPHSLGIRPHNLPRKPTAFGADEPLAGAPRAVQPKGSALRDTGKHLDRRKPLDDASD
jgi:hypothetical protein